MSAHFDSFGNVSLNANVNCVSNDSLSECGECGYGTVFLKQKHVLIYIDWKLFNYICLKDLDTCNKLKILAEIGNCDFYIELENMKQCGNSTYLIAYRLVPL